MTVAAPPALRLTHYINGCWTDSHASEWRDVVNPATGEILAQVPLAAAAEVIPQCNRVRHRGPFQLVVRSVSGQ